MRLTHRFFLVSDLSDSGTEVSNLAKVQATRFACCVTHGLGPKTVSVLVMAPKIFALALRDVTLMWTSQLIFQP